MFSRLTFAAITVFWIVMNVLLWRSELKRGSERGAGVPVNRIWEKILTAPDNSTLEILHHGKKIGFCRWAANVGDELAGGKVSTDDYTPEGMVKQLTGYTIDIDGTFRLKNLTNHVRIDFTLKLSTNHVWQEIFLRANLRPFEFEIRANAGAKLIKLKAVDENGRWERTVGFSDLQNPELIFQEIGNPVLFALAGAISQLPTGLKSSPGQASFGLQWQANSDWLEIGQTQARAYRVRAKLMDRYQIIIFVSRVGELLRVELPNDIVLVNDGLTGLYPGRQ